MARLKKENIAIRSLDGESLFAKALTKMERQQNTRQLLGELPEMVKVTLHGEPEYDEAKGELIYQVQLTPDMDAYRTFLPRLTKALDKLAIKKLPEDILHPEPNSEPEFRGVYILPRKPLTDDPRTKPTQGLISVLTFWNEQHSSHRWTTYVVELGALDSDKLLAEKQTTHWLQQLSRKWPEPTSTGQRYPRLQMRSTAQFLDKQKTPVDLDQWIWACDQYGNYYLRKAAEGSLGAFTKPPEYGKLESPVPNLMITPLTRDPRSDGKNPLLHYWTTSPAWSNFTIDVAPVCLARSPYYGDSLYMRTQITATRRVPISLENLKKISEIELKVETFVDKPK